MSTAIIIATHGNFGAAMLAACERMLGPQERCACIELSEDMGSQDLAARINAKRAEFGDCLVLVDMLGGTPWNAALAQGLPAGDDILAGFSMPLLLEALSLRHSLGPRQLAGALMGKAKAAVVSASTLIAGEMA